MNTKALALFLLHFCMLSAYSQVNRYWVGASIYKNSLTTAGNLADWKLSQDNGSGSWTNSGAGSSILKVDNAAGGAENQLEHVSGSSVRLLPLDPYDGLVELQVVNVSPGSAFSIRAEAYDATQTLIDVTEILSWQSNAGFYTVNLSDFVFDTASTEVRFIISAKNSYSIQGTIELNYFNYYNSNNHWSNAANWSAVSGGAGGASVPGGLDDVFFDGGSATNTIIDVPVTVRNISLTATYTSGLINAGSNDVTSTGNAVFAGGFTVGGNESMYLHNMTLSGTRFVATSGKISISGTLMPVAGNFNPSTGTVEFNAAAPQTVPALRFYHLRLEGTGTKTATGNFTVAGNFINNSSFSASGNTVQFNGNMQQVVSGTGLSRFNHLTLSNSSNIPTLLLAEVEVSGVLTFLANTKLTTGGKLTLIATSPTVSGSIAAFPAGAVIAGAVKVQKYIYSSQRIYRYLSSAVNGATVADWKNSIPITGTFADPSSGPGIASTSPSLFVYNESIPGLQGNGYAAYPAAGVSSAQAPLTVGKGYSVFVRNNPGRSTVLEVSGVINRGTIVIPLTYTSSGLPAEDGWNLVGNPYPSSINWSSIAAADRSNIGNAIYYQDNNLPSPVFRSWVNGVGTNCSSGVISVSQAFWVKATGTMPLLRLRESNKTAATPAFYRTGTDLSLLRISLDSTNSTFRDETVIRISDDATLDFDDEFDAFKLYDATHPAIGSSTKHSPLLSINAFAALANHSDTLDLFVKTVRPGTYTLSVPEYTFDASVRAYLWDTYTHSKQQVEAGTVYSFSVTADSVAATNRFKVILESTALATAIISGSPNAGLLLFPNPASAAGSLTIHCPDAANRPLDVSVYDVTGMPVISYHQLSGADDRYSFTLPAGLSSGMYTLRSATEGSFRATTFIIK